LQEPALASQELVRWGGVGSLQLEARAKGGEFKVKITCYSFALLAEQPLQSKKLLLAKQGDLLRYKLVT
jgi:hypothetical protein